MKLIKTWWLPDEEEHLAEWIEREGDYQTPHRANALRYVKNWDVAVDIGAHVGLWSREFTEKFKSVIAFEPVEAHRECYVKNVTQNYTLHPFALGEKPGSIRMKTVAHSTGGTHVDPDGAVSAEMRTLDSFDIPKIDFMKMDCEAYEIYVLKGARQTLLRCKPVVCLEQKNQRFYGNPRYAASDYLMSLGAKPLSRFKDDCVFGWA
jgi:FkbM family methyltransferase